MWVSGNGGSGTAYVFIPLQGSYFDIQGPCSPTAYAEHDSKYQIVGYMLSNPESILVAYILERCK